MSIQIMRFHPIHGVRQAKPSSDAPGNNAPAFPTKSNDELFQHSKQKPSSKNDLASGRDKDTSNLDVKKDNSSSAAKLSAEESYFASKSRLSIAGRDSSPHRESRLRKQSDKFKKGTSISNSRLTSKINESKASNGSKKKSTRQASNLQNIRARYEEIRKVFKHKHPRELIKEQLEEEFKRDMERCDNDLIPAKSEQLQLVEIKEKNGVEKLAYYNENVFLGRLRKKIAFVMRSISLICFQIIKNKVFEGISLCVIIANCVLLATYSPLSNDAEWQVVLDDVFLGLYTAEMTLKICGLGFVMNRNSYLRDYWNILDGTIVVTAYIPLIFNSGSVNLRSLRTLRVLRPLRTISTIKSLRTLVVTLLKAFPLIKDALLIIFLALFIFAIAGLQLFAGYSKRRCFDPITGRLWLDDGGNDMICGARNCPAGYVCGKTTYNPDNNLSNFDTASNALIIAFQIITLEGWSAVLYEVMDAFTPIAVIYFILLAFIVAYFLLNILMAIIFSIFKEQSENKIVVQDLSYDQKLYKLMEASKATILKQQKKIRAYGGASEFYELKTDGTLKELSKKEALVRRKSTLKNNGKSIYSRITRFMKKQSTTMPSKSNSLRKAITGSFLPEIAGISNHEEHGDNENQPTPRDLQKTQPKIRELEKEVSPTPVQTERQEMLKQIENKKNSQDNATPEGKPGTQDLNNVVPLEEMIDEIKEASDENSIMKEATKDLEEKSAQKLVSKPTPIRPLLSGPFLMKNSNKKAVFPIVGIAGINKAVKTDSTHQPKMYPLEMHPLEMHELFPPSDPLYTSPSKLFGKGSSLSKPRLGVRNQKNIPSYTSKQGSRSAFHRDNTNSFQFSLSDISDNEIRSRKHRRSVKRESTVMSNGGRRRAGSRVLGARATRNPGSKGTLNELEHERSQTHGGTVAPSEHVLRNMNNFVSVFEQTEENKPVEELIENEDQDKFFINIKHLKIVPMQKKVYNSASHEAVLPKVFQRERDQILQKRYEKIRKAKITMVYPKRNPPKAGEKNFDEDTQASRGITSTAIPIRKRTRSQSFKSPSFAASAQRKASVQFDKSLSRKATNKSELAKSNGRASSHNEDGKVDQSGQNKGTKKQIVASQLGLAKGILLDDTAKTYDDIRKRIEDIMEEDKDDQKKSKNKNRFKDEDLDKIEEKYFEIREKELESRKITKQNFSVLDIKAHFPYTVDEENTIRRGLILEKREYDVWHPGFLGLIKHYRNKIKHFTNMGVFVNFILLIVVLNTLILALDGTFTSDTATNVFTEANLVFTIIFAVEMGLKIIGYGIIDYCKDLMNIFDATIVTISLIDIVFSGGGSGAVTAFRSARILRTFRVLRVTRLLRTLAFMKIIVGVISRSVKDFASVAFLISIMLFIYALLGMQILGGKLNNPQNETLYDSLFDALLSSFQVMMTENWNNILQSVFASNFNTWLGSIYLVSWYIIGNWILLNLLLAIILEQFSNDEAKQDQKELEQELNDANDEEDNKMYSQYMAMTGGSSSFTASTKLKKSSTSLNQTSGNHRSGHASGLETTQNAELNMTEDGNQNGENSKSKKKKSLNMVPCEDSLFFFEKTNWLRKFCFAVMTHDKFESVVLVVILFSSLKLAITTYFSDNDTTAQNIFTDMDYGINVFFTLECVIKVFSLGFILDKGSYLRDEWNMLDFFIVVTSLIDMSVSSLNLPFIRVLRLLRTLRPLRFVSHNESMRLVVNSLIKSIPAILNVLVVLFMVWLMFAIFAMSLLSGKLGECKTPVYLGSNAIYGVNIYQCQQMGYTWFREIINFDNIGFAFLSVFTLSTVEGYPDYMALSMNANDDTTGPIYRDLDVICLYYIVFLLVVSQFLMQLFPGVLFMNFAEFHESARNAKRGTLITPAQQKWVDMQKLIVKSKPVVFIPPPKNKIRAAAYFITRIWGDGLYFDFIILAVILANIASMAATYEGSSDQFQNNLTNVNYFFTAVFIAEGTFKILAVGFKNYWFDGWNKFDAFIITTSIIDILISLVGSTLSFLRIGPQLIRVVRVLRVTRLFKLIKKLKGIQKILVVLYLSMPAILNLLSLLFLVYFIFSVLAVFLFDSIVQGIEFDNYNQSFSNFGIAMLTLFRCSTGEDWYKIMYDTYYPELCSDGSTNCGGFWSPVFWIAFMLIAQYIMINMLMSVMLQQFEDLFFSNDALSLETFKENVRSFNVIWVDLSKKYNGQKIKTTALIKLFASLKKPLGYLDNDKLKPEEKQKAIARQIMRMRLQSDQESCVYFNDVLFATLRCAYEEYITEQSTEAMMEFVRGEEIRTLRVINKLKKKGIRKAITLKTEAPSQAFNPLLAFLYFRMGFIAWQNYVRKLKQKEQDNKEKGITFNELDDSETDSEGDEDGSDYYSDSEESSDNASIEEVDENESSASSISRSRSRSRSRSSRGSNKDIKSPKPGEQEEQNSRISASIIKSHDNSQLIGDVLHAELDADANKYPRSKISDQIGLEKKTSQQEAQEPSKDLGSPL